MITTQFLSYSRDFIISTLCFPNLELILLSANLNLISFSNYYQNIIGQIFVFFTLSVSAAEAAVGLAIIVIFFRKKDSIHIDDINTLKG